VTEKFKVQFLEEASEFLDRIEKRPERKSSTTFAKLRLQAAKNFLKN